MIANYLAHAYTKARDPQTATVEEGILKMPMPPGAYTSLEDFEAHREDMFKTNPENYDRYQMQFGLRVLEIYDEQGMGFLEKSKERISQRHAGDERGRHALAAGSNQPGISSLGEETQPI
jgi:hypothetical protein